MIYQLISSTELGELTIKDKLVPKYDLEVKDEEGKIEHASFLGEPPAVGSVFDAEIETVVKNGRTYKNFRMHFKMHGKETELLKKEEKKEEEVQHVAPIVKTTQETVPETVKTVFPKKTRFLSNLEVREKFDFTKEEKIENGKEQNIRIARQGFMNQMSSLRTQFKDFKSWYAIVLELEPIYRLYVETGELPIEKKK